MAQIVKPIILEVLKFFFLLILFLIFMEVEENIILSDVVLLLDRVRDR